MARNGVTAQPAPGSAVRGRRVFRASSERPEPVSVGRRRFRRTGSCRHGDEGASAVEFAIILPLLLILLFGMIQYGFFFYSYQTGKSVADRYLRQLTVGNCQTPADLTTAVYNAMVDATTAGSATTDGFAATATYDNPSDASVTDKPLDIGGSVTLTVTYPTLNMHIPLVPFLSDSTLTQSLTGRVEDTESEGCQ